MYQIIDTLRHHQGIKPNERNHQLPVSFAGIKEVDSVLYYLDTIRNKQAGKIRAEREFFEFLKDDPRYLKLLADHGIPPN